MRFTGTDSSHHPFNSRLSQDTLMRQHPLRQAVRFGNNNNNSWFKEYWEDLWQGWRDNRVHRFQTSSFLFGKLWEGLGNIAESIRFRFFSPSLAPLQQSIAELTAKSPIGFPKAFARAQLFRDNNPAAFSDYATLRHSYSRNTVSPNALAEQFIRSESDAYMATHLLALEQALSDPKHMIKPEQARNRALSFAIDDANGIVTRRVKQLYGHDTRLVHKELYELIFETPKVNLHEHARGSFPIPGLRAALIEDKHPRAYDDYEDLQNYYRAQRPFTEDGKVQLFAPSLNRYRTKYDLMVRAAKTRWQYYMGTYMYSLRAGLENVRYFEYRYYPFSPKDPLPNNPKPDAMTLAENNARAVQLGLDDAKGFLSEYHSKKLDANMIFSAYRATALAFDGLEFAKNHPDEARKQRVDDATKVLDAAIHCRAKGLRVTGFDICGDEENFAITDFASVGKKLRDYNRDAFSKFTNKETTEDKRIGASIHAGEVYESGKISHPNTRPLTGDESVLKTIELFWEGLLVTRDEFGGVSDVTRIDGKQAHDLFKQRKLLPPEMGKRQEVITVSPVRIGHGVRAAQSPTLLEFCRLLRIGFEQCPKSNRQTGVISRYEDSPAVNMSRYGIPVSISRDNATVSKTNSTNELIKLTRYNHANHEDRKRFQTDGLNTAFVFNAKQLDTLRSEMNYMFEDLEERHNSVILKEQNEEQRHKLLNWDVTPDHSLAV